MKHLPTILSETVDHNKQAYDTAGDYNNDFGSWYVKISKLPDWRMEAAIFIHEFVEMCLTTKDNIKWVDITSFDTTEGASSNDPGSLPQAPYHKQHMKAEDIEKIFCEAMNLDWEEYIKALDHLEYKNGR